MKMKIKRFNQLNEKKDNDINLETLKDENGNITINVSISNIDDSTAKDFLKMFSFMEWSGNVGAGRSFKAYFDGDGHFRPKIKIDGFDMKEIKSFNDDWDKDTLDLNFGS